MLGLINMRLRQAIPESKNKPFGGCSIIIFKWYITASRNGLTVYKYFKEAYELNVVQRQSDESDKQWNFRNILLRLHEGESSLDDWRILTKRIYTQPNTNSFRKLFSYKQNGRK